MNYENMDINKVVDAYEDVEHRSRDAVIKFGGSISHHHGVGKLRKRFMEQSYTPVNNEFFRGVKQQLDPKNVFAANNTIYKSEFEREKDLEHKV